jgi:hypothetical protein
MKVNEVLSDQINEALPYAAGFLAAQAIRAAAAKGVPWAVKLLKKTPKGLAPVTQKAKDYKSIRQLLKKAGVSNKAAKAIAVSRINKIPSTTLSFLKWGLTLDYINDYFVEIAELESQLERVRAGDTTTEIFGTMSVPEAENAAKEFRNKRLAETVAVGMLGFGVASKALNGLGLLGKSLGTAALGKGAAGQAVGAGLSAGPRLGAMLAKLVEGGSVRNIALITFLQSDMGKKFLENAYVDMITQPAGALLSATINLGIQALEAAGIQVPDAAKSKISPPGGKPPASTAAQANVPRQLQVQRDPNNPKIMYINRVQVTDANGNQFVGNKMLDDIKRFATRMNMPNHEVFSIPKDPNKIYDPYGFKPR